MSEEAKRTRKSHAQYVAEAVESGIGTVEEMEKLTVTEIKKLATQETTVIVEVSEEVAQTIEKIPQCRHEYKRVRVVASPANYIADKCWKCGNEIRVDD